MKYVVLFFLFLISCLSAGASTESSEIQARVFGGAKNFSDFYTASTVTASRLDPPDMKDAADLGKYRVITTVPVPLSMIQELRAIFSNPGTYSLDSAKGCLPSYGVRFTFGSGSKAVALDICLECDIFAVSRNGKVVGGEDFDSAAPKLLTMIKTLFPKDKALQEFQ